MYQNPNAGMAKFLGSIGDMRRQWEQEEQVRQQQKRAEEAHQQNIAKGALDMTLAQSDEARRVAEEKFKEQTRPLELRRGEQQLTEGDKRMRNLDLEYEQVQEALRIARKYGDREAEAKLDAHAASILRDKAAAAASGAQARQAEFELGQGKADAGVLDAINPTTGRSNRELKVLGPYNPYYKDQAEAVDALTKFHSAAARYMQSGGVVPQSIINSINWSEGRIPGYTGRTTAKDFADMTRTGNGIFDPALTAAIRGQSPQSGGIVDVFRQFSQLPPPQPTAVPPTKPKAYGSREEPQR